MAVHVNGPLELVPCIAVTKESLLFRSIRSLVVLRVSLESLLVAETVLILFVDSILSSVAELIWSGTFVA